MAKQDQAGGNDIEQRGGGGSGGGGRGRYALYGLAGVGLLAVAGAGYFFYRERAIEKPEHDVLEADGQFEVRQYPQLLIAEATATGERDYALDRGFSQLADYIFAKSRGGDKVPMTAPVLSAAAGQGQWTTRFVMPSAFTRETLPEAGAGVRIDHLPARKVAVVQFGGGEDETGFQAREAQLRSWIGAKKFTARGEAERAYYNSPFMPGPLRKAEILIPIG